MLERRLFVLTLSLTVMASGCTEPSPLGLTLTKSGQVVLVTRGCRQVRIKSLEIGWYGRNQVPGDSDDELLFVASTVGGVSVDRLVLDAPVLSAFSTTGNLDRIKTDNRPLYAQVRIANRNISYVIGFRYERLTESAVTGDRVKPFDPSDFCVAPVSLP